jgi:hypothetical protein
VSPVIALIGYQPSLCINVDKEPPEKSTLAAKEQAKEIAEIRACLEENLKKA